MGGADHSGPNDPGLIGFIPNVSNRPALMVLMWGEKAKRVPNFKEKEV